MSADAMMLCGALVGALLGSLVGYLLGLREGDRRSRPSWDEKEAREARAWHEGVAFGKHLEQCKKELGL
jgi:membrane protein YqaA with SNARE-associated domain